MIEAANTGPQRITISVFDAVDQVVEVITAAESPDRRSTTYNYDGFGRERFKTEAFGTGQQRTTESQYNLRGEMIWQIDALGRKIE